MLQNPMPKLSIPRLTSAQSAIPVCNDYAIGDSAVRFVIAPSDPTIAGGIRAEIRDSHVASNGEQHWYRFSTMVPFEFPSETRHKVVLAQWHEQMPPGVESLRPPLAHRLCDGDFLVTLWNKDIFDRGGDGGPGRILYHERQFQLGRFHEFVYRIVWLPDRRGRVVGWKRVCSSHNELRAVSGWERFIDCGGPLGYPKARGYYFKLGLYTTHPFEKPMCVYHRGYDEGVSAASIGAVDQVFGD